MTGSYAQNWPGSRAWASRGAGFAAEWSERESRDAGNREGRDEGERGRRRGRKGHRHHQHDAAHWLFFAAAEADTACGPPLRSSSR